MEDLRLTVDLSELQSNMCNLAVDCFGFIVVQHS